MTVDGKKADTRLGRVGLSIAFIMEIGGLFGVVVGFASLPGAWAEAMLFSGFGRFAVGALIVVSCPLLAAVGILLLFYAAVTVVTLVKGDG